MNTTDPPKESRKRAYLLMCCDSGYFQHVAVCLTSLLASNPHIDFDTTVLVTRYNEQCADKLRRSVKTHTNLTLNLVEFDSEHLSGLPHPSPYYPPEIYARFWVEDYFSTDVERVIYLDGDLVVIGLLDELLTVPMGADVLAAVSIPGSACAETLSYDPAYEYFNSGVMVINLKRWREIGARNILTTAVHQIADRLENPDQDALNYCFHARRTRLDYIWNVITPYFREQNTLALKKDEIARVVREARIVHFNGASKPWQYLCIHPFKQTYLGYLAQTEWHEYRPADYNIVNVVKKTIRQILGERHSATVSRVLRKVAPWYI